MRIVRNPLAISLSVMAAFALAQGCSKDSDSKDDGKKEEGDGGGDAGGGDGGDADADALLKDDYQGVYQLVSQVETPFSDCDGEEEPIEGMGALTAYFKLDTVFEVTMDPEAEPKIDLWLYECTDQATCQGQVVNFLFPEKTDGVWGGQTSIGVGNSAFEPGKCSFSYTERQATLTGTDIVIVTTSYSGDVDKIGTGCMSSDGGADVYEYYAAYKGKVACDGRETVKGTKLDVPMPE